jgi:8-oxo-dGTP pyrophosphatase MutT (NUDIX family)
MASSWQPTLTARPRYRPGVPELPHEFVLPDGFLPAEPVPVVTPKDAATVVLLREAPTGFEVFLQRRAAGMAFASGMTVFPGGGVEARDSASVAWAGPRPSWWARRFGCDETLAQALVCAAVRETFEESGVLLAGPDEHSIVDDATRHRDARAALVARELSIAQFLADARLVLRADLLRPWANWVTPEGEPRRYDTRFLLAALPAGQQADAVTTEAADAGWQTPAAALTDWRAGRRLLLPPTWYTLAELALYGTVTDVMAASDDRRIEKITPRIVREPDGPRVVLPGEPGHGDAHLDP